MKKLSLIAGILTLATTFARAEMLDDPFQTPKVRQLQLQQLQELAQPAARLPLNGYAWESLEFSVFNSWTHQTMTLSLSPTGDAMLFIGQVGQMEPTTIRTRLTTQQKAKLEQMWRTFPAANGEHRIEGWVPDAPTFKLTFSANKVPGGMSRVDKVARIAGTVTGSTIQSSWSKEERAQLGPLVNYLSALRNAIPVPRAEVTLEQFKAKHEAAIRRVPGVFGISIVYTIDPIRIASALQIFYAPTWDQSAVQTAVEAAVPEIKDHHVVYAPRERFRPEQKLP